jgi:hypothetical protein
MEQQSQQAQILQMVLQLRHHSHASSISSSAARPRRAPPRLAAPRPCAARLPQVVDVFAMPQSGTGVSVEAVDPVFQTKMLDMLKQVGR